MKKTALIFYLAGFISFSCLSQNMPPVFGSLGSPSIANGYSPGSLYNLYVNFNENSSLRSIRLKISNQANPGVVGTSSQIPSSIDTFTQNGMFYLVSDTGTSATWNFKWTAPSSAGQTITFELVASAEDLGGTQTDVVYTCQYQLTGSSFGLTGNCSNSLQVGIRDNYNNSNNLEVYPNPASERITISYTIQQAENSQIDILDLNGKLVQTLFRGYENPGVCTHQAEVGELAQGTYLVKVANGAQTAYSKISVR